MLPLLALKNTSWDIDGKRIVDSVSMEIAPGVVVGLLGPNGAGKSTLLRMAAGLLAVSAGTISLNGRELTSWPRTEIARQIAFVPQDTHVEFDFTAYEIALMGRNPYLARFQWPTASDHEAVRVAMEQTHTLDLKDRAITTLSGGERQRVFLARALASQTPFLVLDEPTSSLDLEHTLQFLNLARRLAEVERKGVLLAMHDLNWAMRFCDQVALINHGQIMKSGQPTEVLTAENIRQVFHVEAISTVVEANQCLFDFRPLK